MEQVWGRERLRASLVKPSFVSPKPCKRIRIFSGGPFSGGTISQMIFEGKSSLVGRRGSGSVVDIEVVDVSVKVF